jgi:CHASE3 domain sensor protein
MNALVQRFSVITGFALLAFLLILNAVVTRQHIAVAVDNQSWVVHTAHVRHRLTEIELLVTDAETGQRGYLFTGDPSYLDPYNYAIVDLNSRTDDLAQLIADNPLRYAAEAQLRQQAKWPRSSLKTMGRAFIPICSIASSTPSSPQSKMWARGWGSG